MKRPLLIVIVIGLVAAVGIGVFYFARKYGDPYTASTDPADYEACVQRGGEIKDFIAPSVCTEGNKNYYDGNW